MKSKLNPKNIIKYTVLVLLFSISSIWFFTTLEWNSNPLPASLFLMFWITLGLFVIWSIARNLNIIEIDQLRITYTNVFTRNSTAHYFNEIDGFVYMDDLTSAGWVRTIYLVKNRIMFGRISQFDYSNFDQLEARISRLEFLGEQSHSHWKAFKVVMGGKVEVE